MDKQDIIALMAASIYAARNRSTVPDLDLTEAWNTLQLQKSAIREAEAIYEQTLQMVPLVARRAA